MYTKSYFLFCFLQRSNFKIRHFTQIVSFVFKFSFEIKNVFLSLCWIFKKYWFIVKVLLMAWN